MIKKNVIQEIVAKGLAGQEVRQAQRDARRRDSNIYNRIRTARTTGLLAELAKAKEYLEVKQIPYRETRSWGCAVLRIRRGLELTYDPTGKLSHAPRNRKPRVVLPGEQQPFLIAAPVTESKTVDDSLGPLGLPAEV